VCSLADVIVGLAIEDLACNINCCNRAVTAEIIDNPSSCSSCTVPFPNAQFCYYDRDPKQTAEAYSNEGQLLQDRLVL